MLRAEKDAAHHSNRTSDIRAYLGGHGARAARALRRGPVRTRSRTAQDGYRVEKDVRGDTVYCKHETYSGTAHRVAGPLAPLHNMMIRHDVYMTSRAPERRARRRPERRLVSLTSHYTTNTYAQAAAHQLQTAARHDK